MYLYRLITHTTQFNAFFLIWDPPSIFLASFLIWPTKSTLPLCSLYSYCALYTIWYFYKLQIHSHIHTRIRIRIHMKSYIWRACWQLPFPLGLSQSSYTCVFNLFALIIHNSINANKLTLSKMLYRFSLFLLFLPLSPSLSAFLLPNNPVIIWASCAILRDVDLEKDIGMGNGDGDEMEWEGPPITLPGN